MKPVYDAIRNILNTYFSESATYSVQNIDSVDKKLVLDVDKQFIYGTNFPIQTQQPLQTTLPKNGIINQPIRNSTNATYIFYQPIDKVYTRSYSINETQEVVVDDVTYTQTVQRFMNSYFETFNLIFWSKSISNTDARASFLFSEIFFNIFRGNINIIPFLQEQKVFDFNFNNFQVQDLSFIENQNGVSRYQAKFTARYEIQTNTNVVDNLHNIVIDKTKIFS